MSIDIIFLWEAPAVDYWTSCLSSAKTKIFSNAMSFVEVMNNRSTVFLSQKLQKVIEMPINMFFSFNYKTVVRWNSFQLKIIHCLDMKFIAVLVISVAAFVVMISASTIAGKKECPDCGSDGPPKPFNCFCNDEALIRETYIYDCGTNCTQLKFCCLRSLPEMPSTEIPS